MLELPAITTSAIEENEGLHDSLQRLQEYQWIAFTSPTGVRVFFEEMERCSVDIRKMAGVKIAAIGEGTKKN